MRQNQYRMNGTSYSLRNMKLNTDYKKFVMKNTAVPTRLLKQIKRQTVILCVAYKTTATDINTLSTVREHLIIKKRKSGLKRQKFHVKKSLMLK